MDFLKYMLIRATGNRLAQVFLERNAQVSQYLMGIGAGGAVASSGERAVFGLLKREARSLYRIFDVGANRGDFLELALAEMESCELEIHCFEPSRDAFALLVERAGQDARITLSRVGLGRESAKAVLHYDVPGSGLASLTRRRLDHFGIDVRLEEEVTIETLDRYCAEKSIDRIHLLKIDIEGHELDALAGARVMFARKAIDIVTFEFGGCNIDTRTFFQDFWYFFKEAGFGLYRITPSGYLHPLASYSELQEQFRTVNFVAVANG